MSPAPYPADPGPGGAEAAALAVTEDGFLDNRLILCQPRDGYRAAIDPLFLAAAVPAADGQRALDIGCGVGVAALALAWRVPGLRVAGMEIDPALLRLCVDNARTNGFAERTDFMVGDVAHPPARLAPGSFDHVMANPPFLETARANVSPDAGRAGANVEGRAGPGGNGADLAAWLRLALTMVRTGGTVTVVHRADRLDEVTQGLKPLSGGITVFPLWPDAQTGPAKRVLVQAIKGSKAPLSLARGLVLHEDGGGFTPQAEAVLRGGAGLRL